MYAPHAPHVHSCGSQAPTVPVTAPDAITTEAAATTAAVTTAAAAATDAAAASPTEAAASPTEAAAAAVAVSAEANATKALTVQYGDTRALLAPSPTRRRRGQRTLGRATAACLATVKAARACGVRGCVCACACVHGGRMHAC